MIIFSESEICLKKAIKEVVSSAWGRTVEVKWRLRTGPLGATASSYEMQLNGFDGSRGYSWKCILSRYSQVMARCTYITRERKEKFLKLFWKHKFNKAVFWMLDDNDKCQICLVWVLPAFISLVILIHESWNCVPKLSKAIITIFSGIVPIFFTLFGQSVLIVVYKLHPFVHTSFQYD